MLALTHPSLQQSEGRAQEGNPKSVARDSIKAGARKPWKLRPYERIRCDEHWSTSRMLFEQLCPSHRE